MELLWNTRVITRLMLVGCYDYFTRCNLAEGQDKLTCSHVRHRRRYDTRPIAWQIHMTDYDWLQYALHAVIFL